MSQRLPIECLEILPLENRVRELLSYAADDTNLDKLLSALIPEQRLVNLHSNEVKLVSAVVLPGVITLLVHQRWFLRSSAIMVVHSTHCILVRGLFTR